LFDPASTRGAAGLSGPAPTGGAGGLSGAAPARGAAGLSGPTTGAGDTFNGPAGACRAGRAVGP